MRRVVQAALGLVFVLHLDLWLWDDGRLIAGLVPVTLAWHVGLCLAAALLMALAVRFAWPRYLQHEPGTGDVRAPAGGDR